MDYENEYVERYEDDDLYQYNLNEADDYRNEGGQYDQEDEETCDTCNGEGAEDGCPECGMFPDGEYVLEPQEDFGYFGEMGLRED